MNREEKAQATELAKLRAMPGVTVYDTPAQAKAASEARRVTSEAVTPPRAEWLPCWRKVFKGD
jgi:hypothetical protein